MRKSATRRTQHVPGAGRRRSGRARPGGDRPFHSQIQKARRRVDRLQRLAGETHRRQDLLDQALHELSSALVELQVAAEEVQRQNRELETASARIELERRRYLVLFDRAPHGYVVTDGEGAIRQANRAGGDLIGARPENLLGKPISLYVRGERGRNAHLLIPRLHRGEVLAAEEVVLQPRHGPPVPALLSGASLDGPPGVPAELLWMLQDIRRRKSAEEALRQAHDKLEIDNRRRQELESDLRLLSARLLKAQEEERQTALIGEWVLYALGTPTDLHKVQVRRLWEDHYRVNVLVGPDAASVKVAHSYFVVTAEDRNVVSSVPEVTRW